MSSRDAKILGGAILFTLVAFVFYRAEVRASERRGGAPSDSELYITGHPWVLLPLPIVLFILEYVTGFARFLYDLFNGSQPTSTAGVVVGGVPVMGTAFFFVLVATVMIAGALGMLLTSYAIDLVLHLKRGRRDR